nr:type II toxin-antitoxin system RelB/DinJ family antitoxin [Pseudomonas neuropathica]
MRIVRAEKIVGTPCEGLRQALEDVVDWGKLPLNESMLREENEKLIGVVTERLAAPQRVKASLDDL